MITVYGKDESKFDNNGLGILQMLSCEVIQELNGLYEVECSIMNGSYNSNYVVNDNVIRVPTPVNNQLFRVYEVNKDVDGDIINFKGKHIFYDLLKCVVSPIEMKNVTAKEVGQYMLSKLDKSTKFVFDSDIMSKNDFISVDENAVKVLMGDDKSILGVYGGEIYRDNFGISIKSSIGDDRGYTIAYGKNLTGFEYSESFEKLVTRIKPIGKYNDDTPLYLSEMYVDSEYINEIGVYTGILQCNDLKVGSELDGEILKANSIRKIMIDRCKKMFDNGADKPYITIDLDFIVLTDTTKYKDITMMQELYIGDIVTLIHRKNNINTKLQVIRIEYNALTKRYSKLSLGQPLVQLSNTVAIIESGNTATKEVILAEAVRFDNSKNGMESDKVQQAIEELLERIKIIEENR